MFFFASKDINLTGVFGCAFKRSTAVFIMINFGCIDKLNMVIRKGVSVRKLIKRPKYPLSFKHLVIEF